MHMLIHGRPATMAALFRTPETRDATLAALADVGSLAVRAHLGEVDQPPADWLPGDAPDLLLLDVDMDQPAQLRALETLAAGLGEGTALLVTAERPSVAGLRLLLRLGIADLIPQPLAAGELVEAVGAAITALRRRRGDSAHAQRGRVVSFLKACGGVGATSLAVQAACALAPGRVRKSRRAPAPDPQAPGAQSQTCLLDFDLQFGAAALHLDIDHSASLIELPDISRRFDGTLLRSAMAHHATGIDLLPAPRPLHPMDVVTPETAATLVHVAALEYRHVLVDLPQTWTEWTRAVLGETDCIVLVLRPDVPAIRHARRQLETLAAEGCGEIPVVTVANFDASGLFASGIGAKEAAASLGRAVDHAIPRADRAFADCANFGQPLCEVKGGGRPARRIAAMIQAALAAAGARLAATTGGEN